MTSPAKIAYSLSCAQREVVRGLTADRAVLRPGHAGTPFHLSPVNLNSTEGRMRFPEALILGLIADGLLYATQATGALPGRPEGVIFSARLSKAGSDVRLLLKEAA